MSSPVAVEVEGVAKSFGTVNALSGVDLRVPAGAVVGLLGPNGAGKTTLVRILATLLRPDAGTVRVGGFDVATDAHRVRQLISSTGQYASIDDELTGRENLTMVGRLLGHPQRQARARAEELLVDFELADAADRAAKSYSGGMRRRLDLAAGLVGRPKILFLDEPTTGLDPAARRAMWERITALVVQGTSVLLTTQYLEEADVLADTVIVLHEGSVVATGTSDELRRRTGNQTLQLRVLESERLDEATGLVAAAVGAPATIDPTGAQLTVPIADPQMMPTIVRRLDDAGLQLAELSLRLPSLDEVFLAYTGHRLTPDNGDAAPADTSPQGGRA